MEAERTRQRGHHGMSAVRGLQQELWQGIGYAPIGPAGTYQRFRRLFPNLPPLEASAERLCELAETMREPEGYQPKKGRAIASGYTFLGQFIDHDITLDVTSSLERQIDPAAVENVRTPVLELDSVYGAGPEVQPYLYDQDAPGRLLTGFGGDPARDRPANPEDLPRNAQGRALIGDPRNDENGIVSQLQLAVIKFHNAVLERLRAGEIECRRYFEEDFEEAQRLARWHYQWIVVNEYLPLIVDGDVLESIRRDGFRVYRWATMPFIPVEFAVAAYRFGHSQVRSRYTINGERRDADLFKPPADALASFEPVPPADVVDWRYLLEIDGSTPEPGRPIDRKLAAELFELPFAAGTGASPRSLPERNLLRGRTFGLPSGEAVACLLGLEPLPLAEEVRAAGLGQTPLWYYVLQEAEAHKAGKLTGVGGRIVAETLLGLLTADPRSYLSVSPCWTPCLPGARRGDFGLADLLTLAGTQTDAA
ncbi:MAG: peroxidase [Gammaproteobacteria bacterium]|nr:peroxidase [Gammaproteobacteria bacterium]